ncbi:pentatricopeptide repeat-containing protein At2g03380, mitochondrial-like [Aristolochia californica]|uniref:pentatricopeptide repeat-containing protein At2g03380, mitochondrial-like n=1 Tax=Aristolochia californica TaxID=171875 RepID=UPI0035E20C9F
MRDGIFLGILGMVEKFLWGMNYFSVAGLNSLTNFQLAAAIAMQKGEQCLTEHDHVIFSITLKASSELHDFNEGRKLHSLIFKVGSCDSFVSTGLIGMYAKCGIVEFARDVFNEVSEKDVVSWTSMIAGYVQNDGAEEGLNLFNERRWILVEPNELTVGFLLNACLKLAALHQGKWVHGYIIKNEVSLNSLLGTSLLDMYVKCGNIADARCVFNELPAIDLASWTAMVLGYTQRGHPSKAMELFPEKKWETMVPNSVTITGLLSACLPLRKVKMRRVVHLLGIQFGLVEDAIVRNDLVDMYAKCGMVGYANFIFSSNLSEDVVPWNSMIGGFALNGYAIEALSWFHRLRSSSTLPDAVTLVNVISACTYAHGMLVQHAGQCEELGLAPTTENCDCRVAILSTAGYANTGLLKRLMGSSTK